MNWFSLVLITILAWSFGDIFTKLGSPKNNKYSHLKMASAVGLVMGLTAIFQLIFGIGGITLSEFVKYLPISFFYISSMICGYLGMRYIAVSINSPICNSSGALVAVMCFVILKQTMDWLQFISVAAISVGIFLISVFERKTTIDDLSATGGKPDRKATHGFLAIIFPILYLFLDAMGTFLDSVLINEGDIPEFNIIIAYELTFFAVGIVCFIYVFLIKKEKFSFSKNEGFFITAAAFETIGEFTYVFALASEQNTIIAAPMIGSYCVFSVLWSRIFLKEKLSRKHYAVITLVLVGIVALGIGGVNEFKELFGTIAGLFTSN